MDVIVVVDNNLLDSTRIKEAARTLPHNIITCSDISRITHMLEAGPGDREFTVIFDYYVYETEGFEKIRKKIDEVAHANGIKIVNYKSFVPHEKIKELEAAHPGVNFMPRSIFFRDLVQHLS